MIGPNADKAFLCERLDGLANRRARYFEALTDLPFIEPRSRRQNACHNLIAQNCGRITGQVPFAPFFADRKRRQEARQGAQIILSCHNASSRQTIKPDLVCKGDKHLFGSRLFDKVGIRTALLMTNRGYSGSGEPRGYALPRTTTLSDLTLGAFASASVQALITMRTTNQNVRLRNALTGIRAESGVRRRLVSA